MPRTMRMPSSDLRFRGNVSELMHQLFFPPRFQFVVLEKNANRLPAHVGRQLPLHRFLGDQPHAPPRRTLGRRTAHHGDDPLDLACVQHSLLARSRLFVQCRLQSFFFIAPGNGPHRFPLPHPRWRRPAPLSALGRAGSRSKLAAAHAPIHAPFSAFPQAAVDPSSLTAHARDDSLACLHYAAHFVATKVTREIHIHAVTDLVTVCQGVAFLLSGHAAIHYHPGREHFSMMEGCRRVRVHFGPAAVQVSHLQPMED